MLPSRFIGAGLLGLAALVLVQPACVTVLGLDDYGPIAEGICKCDAELGFLDDCQATLTRRLEGASPEARQKWLERFEKKKCVECRHALECYYTSPTCLKDGAPCSEHEECCGFDGDGGYCSLDGKCVRPSPSCQPTAGACATHTDCCGSEGGYGECQVFGEESTCLHFCNPSDDFACPGCCFTVTVPTLSLQTSICLLGCEGAANKACDPDADPATQCPGQACCPVPDDDSPALFVFLCVSSTCSDQMPDQ